VNSGAAGGAGCGAGGSVGGTVGGTVVGPTGGGICTGGFGGCGGRGCCGVVQAASMATRVNNGATLRADTLRRIENIRRPGCGC
jgi:hypothetical protein